MKAKTAILIGAGARGARAYAPYALKNPHELNMVAVAEPNKERRDQFQHDHRLQDERTFASWEDELALGKIADIDRKSTRLNSSHVAISYAVFCLKKKKK